MLVGRREYYNDMPECLTLFQSVKEATLKSGKESDKNRVLTSNKLSVCHSLTL